MWLIENCLFTTTNSNKVFYDPEQPKNHTQQRKAKGSNSTRKIKH